MPEGKGFHMKTDLQKMIGDLSKVALVAGFLFSALASSQCFATGTSTEAEQVMELQAEVPAQGRATLTAEDLQTLLGLKSRDPSSKGLNQKQDVSDSAATFNVSISSKEKARIIHALRELEIERSAYKTELEDLRAAEINTLRDTRRKIQLSRTHAVKEDTRLGRDLFNSLLAEANAEASVEESLKQFDAENAIEIQFSLSKQGERAVAAIKLGSKLVWETQQGDSMLAKR